MKRFALILSLLLVFLIPMSLIAYTSALERQQYKAEDELPFAAMAYGEVCEVVRRSFEEAYAVEGRFVSAEYGFEEIPGSSVHLCVDAGDEVRPGDLLAYADGKAVYGDGRGLVDEIFFEETGVCLRLLSFDRLVLEAQIDENIPLNENTEYATREGAMLTPVFLSEICTDGMRLARFAVSGSSLPYGAIASYQLLTGTVYQNVLCVDSSCVYQKEASGPFFLRRTDKTGKLIGEVEIQNGFSDGFYTCITGAEEGWFADGGYSRFMQFQ